MGDENFEKLYNNLNLELSKFLIKVKTCISLSNDIEESTKQRCRQWVTKLSEYSDLNVSTLNNHISHAKILLDMLLKNKFDHPFSQHPPSSPLPPLIDDYSFITDIDAIFSNELDKYFVNSKIEDSMNNLESQESKIFKDFDLDKLNSIFTAKQQELERLLLKSESPTKQKSNKIEKLENKILMMKDKFKQKLIAMENIHESKLKQIMMRKNAELEIQMEENEKKLLQLESEKQTLVMKYRHKVEEATVNRRQEISELKEQHALELRRAEEFISDKLMKQSKDNLQPFIIKHRKDLKELEDEKDAKIKELSDSVNYQLQANMSRIVELENDIKELVDENKRQDRKMEECEGLNDSLRKEMKKQQDEIDARKTSLLTMESELEHLRSDHKLEMKTLKYQSETLIDTFKQKYLSSKVKVSEKINTLQQLLDSKEVHLKLLEKEKLTTKKLSEELIELKRSSEVKDEEMRKMLEGKASKLKELNELHLQKCRQIEMKHLQEFEESTKIFQDKIECYKDNNQTLRNELGDKNEVISSLKNDLETTTERLKNFEEEFKKEREELLIQISSSKNELSEMRSSRQKVEQMQTNKFKKLKEHLTEQMSLQAQKLDGEKKELMVTVTTSRESFKREKELLVRRHEKSMMEMEVKCNERAESDSKIRGMLEGRIERLESERDEVMKNSRKEINGMEGRRIEEIKSLKQQHQFEIDALNLKSTSDVNQSKDLYRDKKKKTAESHFLKLKKLELNFESEILESAKTINQMSEKLQSMEQKSVEQIGTFNDKVELMEGKFRNEKELLIAQIQEGHHKINKMANKLLEKDVQIKECEKQHEEKVSLLKCEHLEIMKTMIPSSVKQDLEKAIDALRSQVASLKGRIQLMEKH